MGRAIETVGVQAIAPGPGGAAGAAFPGNSLTIRDNPKSTYLIDLWQRRQTTGFTRITSPLIHDTSVGMGGRGPTGTSYLFRGWHQRVHSQDTLTVNISGGAVAGDIELSWLTFLYEDLPGVDGRFISSSELDRRGEDVYSFTATITTGVAGGWSGEESIIAEQDQLKANRDYAWLGGSWSVGRGAFRLRGVDTGNLGVAMPVDELATDSDANAQARGYWQGLSKALGDEPVIPVINSSNKAVTLIDGATDENANPIVGVVTLVLLGPTGRKNK